ncbi:hypothetical protein HY772_09020, partial [Candidatus Woesearchaeota archaeon]|nr:hypothetical protein [Candidatus Woesearchaeota archaeon]
FANDHAIAIILFAEGQHHDDNKNYSGRYDTPTHQKNLDAFIKKYIKYYDDLLTPLDRKAIYNVPPHGGQTPSRR